MEQDLRHPHRVKQDLIDLPSAIVDFNTLSDPHVGVFNTSYPSATYTVLVHSTKPCISQFFFCRMQKDESRI